MNEFSDKEGTLLVEVLRAGSMRWDTYNERCSELGLVGSRLFFLRMLEFSEMRMKDRKHEGRGCVTEPEVTDDSLVRVAESVRPLIEQVSRVREVFCDDPPPPNVPVSTSSPRRRGFKPLRSVPQRNMFPPVD